MNAFVTVYRERPAFVEIWLRGRTNQAIKEYGRAHNKQVAHDLHALASDLGLVTAEGTRQIAEIAVEMGDRLFQLAFESDLARRPDGARRGGQGGHDLPGGLRDPGRSRRRPRRPA